jgi:hypothetical protein
LLRCSSLLQIGISANLKWANLNEQYFGCTDGRARSPLITTPGGDLGEFIRALTVMSAKAGKVYTDADVKSRLVDFLKHNPVKRFAMCTDQKAMGAIIEATSVAEADFDITKPPPAFPSAALPMLTEAKFNVRSYPVCGCAWSACSRNGGVASCPALSP